MPYHSFGYIRQHLKLISPLTSLSSIQLLGAAALGLGIWAYVDKNKMAVLAKVGADNTDFNITGLLESAAIVLMVGGAAILLIGFLGCCGAFKESQCLLVLVSIIVLVCKLFPFVL